MPPSPPPETPGRWQTAQMLQGDTNLSSGPQVVLDQTGRALVVWTDGAGLWSSLFTSNAGWSSPERLQAGTNFGTLQVAMNTSGVGVMTWLEWVSPDSAGVFAKRFTLGSAPEATVRIDARNPSADFANSYLGTAIDPLGNVTALWVAIGVYETRFEPGQGWTPVQVLSTGPAALMAIDTDPNGNVMAAWEEDVQGQSARFQPSLGWRLEPYDIGPMTARLSALSVDSLGNAVLVWNKQSEFSTTGELWTRQSAITGATWGPAEQLAKGGVSAYPAIAGSGGGNRVLVWQDPAGLSATSLAPGGSWPAPLHLPVAQFREGPTVGVDGAGNAIVVWTQWDGTRNEVWAGRFSPSRGWDAAQRIDTVGNNQRPQIVVDPQGKAFVAWAEFGPPYRIWANRFEVAAP
jgi:hypothetical protein